MSGNRCLICRYCLLTGDAAFVDGDGGSVVARLSAARFIQLSTLKAFSRVSDRRQGPVRGTGTRLGYVVKRAKATLAELAANDVCLYVGEEEPWRPL